MALGEGVAAAEQHFHNAEASFRELDNPFDLAVVSVEHAEELGAAEEAIALREEARVTFELLGAHPWIERASWALPLRTG